MDAVTIKAQAHAWEFLFSVNFDLPEHTREWVFTTAQTAENPNKKLEFTFTQAGTEKIIRHALDGMHVCAEDPSFYDLCRPLAKLYANACEALHAHIETYGQITYPEGRAETLD